MMLQQRRTEVLVRAFLSRLRHSACVSTAPSTHHFQTNSINLARSTLARTLTSIESQSEDMYVGNWFVRRNDKFSPAKSIQAAHLCSSFLTKRLASLCVSMPTHRQQHQPIIQQTPDTNASCKENCLARQTHIAFRATD